MISHSASLLLLRSKRSSLRFSFMDQKLFSKALTRYALASRSYHTTRLKKATLYAKISPLGDPRISVESELDGWVQEGKKLRVAELQRIIRDFRKRNRFSQALEVRIILFFWFEYLDVEKEMNCIKMMHRVRRMWLLDNSYFESRDYGEWGMGLFQIIERFSLEKWKARRFFMLRNPKLLPYVL